MKRGTRVLVGLVAFLISTGGQAMVFRNMPKKVKVGRKTYTIEYKEVLEEGKLLGVCMFDEKKIQISLEKGKKEAESTVLHEMLHAMANEYRFDLSEKKVLQIEKALFETLEKNGWTIKKRGE